jgi:hypothetical protein
MLARTLLPLLLSPALSYAQVCGDAHGNPGTTNVSVTLFSKPSSPAFYYREGGDFITFITEDSLLRALAERERSGDPTIKKLAPLIRARLPLKEDRDLYYFNLSDWLFYDPIRRIVALAIEQGHAAIVTSSGAWLNAVTILRRRKSNVAETTIYADPKRNSQILSLIDCISE